MALSPLAEWFHVEWDAHEVRLDVRPPSRSAWRASFPWAAIQRICFQAEGPELSDGVYVFTSLRPESFVIPTEADGGAAFWDEVLQRGLFDPELAIQAASSTSGLFCWPPPEGEEQG